MSEIRGKFAGSYDDFVKRDSLLPPGLSKLVKSFKPKKILEFGSGTGSVAIGLSTGNIDYTAVDLSADMISAAKKKARRYKCKARFIKDDILTIDLKSEFDMLICLGNTVPLIHRLPDARKLFANFARHLRPGGAVIIQQLNYDRILKEKPATFAVEQADSLIRIKQYKYGRDLIDFNVTLIDHSKVPPKMTATNRKIRPWKRLELTGELKKAGFYRIVSYGNYRGDRFVRDSKDLVMMARKR